MGAERLDGEGEVHDLDRVTVPRRQIDDHAPPDQVDLLPIGEAKLLYVAPHLADAGRYLPQPIHVDLDVHAAGVGEDGAVAHPLEVLGGQDVGAAGGGYEDLGFFARIQRGQNVEAVGVGFEAAHRVYLADGDAGAQPRGVARYPLAAPAVAEHDKALAADHQVRVLHDGREGGLARAVAVVEEVLAPGVVGRDGRELQHALALHGFELRHPARRLLRGTPDPVQELPSGRVGQAGETGPVVYEDGVAAVGRAVEDPFERTVGVGRIGAGVGVDRDAALGEGRGHVVLDEEGAGARDGDLGSGFRQHHREVRGLGFDGQGDADAEAVERPVLQVLVADAVQDRGVFGGPVDLLVAVRRQGRVSDHRVGLHGDSSLVDAGGAGVLLGRFDLFPAAEHQAADDDEGEEGEQDQAERQARRAGREAGGGEALVVEAEAED